MVDIIHHRTRRAADFKISNESLNIWQAGRYLKIFPCLANCISLGIPAITTNLAYCLSTIRTCPYILVDWSGASLLFHGTWWIPFMSELFWELTRKPWYASSPLVFSCPPRVLLHWNGKIASLFSLDTIPTLNHRFESTPKTFAWKMVHLNSWITREFRSSPLAMYLCSRHFDSK